METEPRADTPHATISGKVRSADPAVAAFRQQHPNWLERFAKDGPVYRLPRAAIEALQKPPERQPPILTDADVQVELGFFDLCLDRNAVGIWNGLFIGAAYLCSTPLTAADMQGMNWSPRQMRTAQSLANRAGSAWERLKGYVGWLITDPDFIEARNALASQWYALSRRIASLSNQSVCTASHSAAGVAAGPECSRHRPGGA